MVEYYPLASTGYVLLGQEYFTRGFFDKAKDYFEKAVRYGYNDPQIDLQLGVCYFHLGDFKKAKQHLLNVISANPDFPDPYFILGDIYHHQKDYEQERQVLKKAGSKRIYKPY
jgi:tetratricopeptide (TPR) repeat protein